MAFSCNCSVSVFSIVLQYSSKILLCILDLWANNEALLNHELPALIWRLWLIISLQYPLLLAVTNCCMSWECLGSRHLIFVRAFSLFLTAPLREDILQPLLLLPFISVFCLLIWGKRWSVFLFELTLQCLLLLYHQVPPDRLLLLGTKFNL